MTENLHRSRVLIIGAGLCGLSAAYHLENSDESNYIVLEHNYEVGGLARTKTYDGFSFDHSIHILYTRDKYAANLIRNKLLGGNLCHQSREGYCYTSGVYTEYPYQISNWGLPPDIIIKKVLGLIEARYSSSRDAPPKHFERPNKFTIIRLNIY